MVASSCIEVVVGVLNKKKIGLNAKNLRNLEPQPEQGGFKCLTNNAEVSK